MHLHRVSTAVLVCAVLSSGVGFRVAAQAEREAPRNDRADVFAAAGTPMRWQANLRATQQRSAMLGPTTQNKSTGTVFISQAGQERIRVWLMVSTTFQDGSAVQWAIIPGRCGSNMMPIAPVERFPILELGPSGRSELDQVLSLTLPATGQYHIAIYRGGTQFHNVLACGNLARAGG